MIIKVPRPAKDDAVIHDHKHLTRRDFIARGILTGAMTVALPKLLLGSVMRDAVAATACPAPVGDPGGISHLFCEGGMTVGAYILSNRPAEIAAASTNAAARYGINGATMLDLGPSGRSNGFIINQTSIFGAALLQAGVDMGYSLAQWRIVLSRIGCGAHYGCHTEDDGAADLKGLVGGVGPLKRSVLNKDLRVGVSHALTPFAKGMPVAITGGRPTVSTLTRAFSLTPAAAGNTNEQTMRNTANAAESLGSLFSNMLGMNKRTGATAVTTNATCGFLGDLPLVDPNYGPNLFDPTKIGALMGLTSPGKLTSTEQAHLTAYYNAAMGIVSGVAVQERGYDYHGNAPADIAEAAIRVARHVAVWAAASDKSGKNTALIINSNGQAIANGFTTVTAGGVTGGAQNAVGDAGAQFSACTILCHAPVGKTPPRLKTTGTFDPVRGDVRGILGSEVAVQGAYATALMWVTGTLTDAQRTRLGLAGIGLSGVTLL